MGKIIKPAIGAGIGFAIGGPAGALTGAGMGMSMNKPKMNMPKMPNTPTMADTSKAAQDEMDRLKKQRGRAATMLSTGDDATLGGLATKQLLGG
jgi:hypothetical protein